MSKISARCFYFFGNISATICKNLIFKFFHLVRKVFLICAKSDTKNHSNFDYCCSFYVRKEGVNFLFDAICKCGYIAFENVLIDETDMRLLCDTAEDALEILKKYNPKNKGLTVDDATVTIVEIIFSDKNSMSVSMTEQTLDSLEKAFFALAEKYCKDV